MTLLPPTFILLWIFLSGINLDHIPYFRKFLTLRNELDIQHSSNKTEPIERRHVRNQFFPVFQRLHIFEWSPSSLYEALFVSFIDQLRVQIHRLSLLLDLFPVSRNFGSRIDNNTGYISVMSLASSKCTACPTILTAIRTFRA